MKVELSSTLVVMWTIRTNHGNCTTTTCCCYCDSCVVGIDCVTSIKILEERIHPNIVYIYKVIILKWALEKSGELEIQPYCVAFPWYIYEKFSYNFPQLSSLFSIHYSSPLSCQFSETSMNLTVQNFLKANSVSNILFCSRDSGEEG